MNKKVIKWNIVKKMDKEKKDVVIEKLKVIISYLQECEVSEELINMLYEKAQTMTNDIVDMY